MDKIGFKEEKKILKQKLQQVIEYANAQAQIHLKINSIFKEVKQTLDSTLKHVHCTNESDFVPEHVKGPIAPGILGSQSERFIAIFGFADLLIFSLKKYSRIIGSEIISTIEDLNETQNNLIKENLSLVRSSKLKRKEFFHQYLINQQEIENLYASISKQQLSPQLNADSRLTLKSSLSKYFMMVMNHKKANIEINTINSEYIETIKSAITKIKVFLMHKETCLKSMIFIIHPFVSKLIHPLENITKKSGETNSNWESEFLLFARIHKISRTSLHKIQFVPFQFTFQDPLLKPPPFTTRINEVNVPLYIGIVKHDFEAKKKNELSVKKGERIYLYERPIDLWILASKIDSNEFKYVPLKAIEIPETPLMFTVLPQIAKNEDEMTVRAGELLFVKEKYENSDYVLCEDIKGNVKKVHIGCLCG